MSVENILELRSVCAWNILFAHSFYAGLQKRPDQGTFGRNSDLQTQRLFSMVQDFWPSSEAVGLSQVSKMLRQLNGQISAHYRSSNLRNTH